MERESIAVNKAVAAFRQDHGWGIMIHVTSQRAEDGLRVVIRKTPQDICERRQASRPPVVSPFPRRNTGIVPGVRGQMRNSKIKKKSMKKCVVDIRYHAAVGDYSRILVVLTSHQGERTDGRNKRSGMSKDQFWNLIEKAKEVCGTDLDASAVWIKQQLFYMTPEDVLQFHNLVYSYRDAAYKYGLWTAAGIMMEAGCSDDSFSDFFGCGLIAQGKEVYLNALKIRIPFPA